MVLSAEEARRVLGRHLDTLRICIETAWKRYMALPPEARVDMTPRSRASNVYDFMVGEAKRRFFDDPGVLLQESRGFLLMNFSDKILLRFKKFNKSLLPQNIPTYQTSLFMNRGQQGILIECPTATKLIAGYQLDKLQSDIQMMAVVCPDGNACDFYFRLENSSTAEVVLIRDYQDVERLEPRVRAKEGLTNEEAGDEGKDV